MEMRAAAFLPSREPRKLMGQNSVDFLMLFQFDLNQAWMFLSPSSKSVWGRYRRILFAFSIEARRLVFLSQFRRSLKNTPEEFPVSELTKVARSRILTSRPVARLIASPT